MSESIKAMFLKLPTYWKLATLNCQIYAIVAMLTTLTAGLTGYEHWSEITPIGHVILIAACIISYLNTVKAFLDQTLSKLDQGKTGTVQVTTATRTTIEENNLPQTPKSD